MRILSTTVLLACAASVHGQDLRPQSSVTLALTLSFTGAPTSKPAQNSTTVRSAPLETVRLGNREILQDLLADQLLPTTTISGWTVVALWANWPDADPYAGNGYRFFARRGSGANLQTVAIPSSYLSLQPVKATVGYTHTIKDETILGGTETFNVFTETGFGLRGYVGSLGGLHTGSGRYVRPKNSPETYYIPDANKVSLQGVFEKAAETGSGVAAGSLTFGAAALTPQPTNTSVGSTGAVTLTGSIGLTKQGAGSLLVSPAGTITGATSIYFGSSLLTGSIGANTGSTGNGTGKSGSTFTGTTFTSSGTLNLGGSSLVLPASNPSRTLRLGASATTLTISTHLASTESLSVVLSVAVAGTLTLGTGETLNLLADDTLPLDTLTAEQLSRLTWTPTP